MSQPASSDNTPDFIPPPNAGTFLGHPRGLFLLFLVEMWERFSYYGMRGLLVLYLTAAVAVHQLAPSTYTNLVRMEQGVAQSDEDKANNVEHPVTTTMIPMTAVVGSTRSDPGGEEIAANLGPLQIERGVWEDGADGKRVWRTLGQGLLAPTFNVKEGERPTGEPIRYRITNPTDQKIDLTMKVERPFAQAEVDAHVRAAMEALPTDATPEARRKAEADARTMENSEYKIYFTVNDSTGVVSTSLVPETERLKSGARPFEITLDINRHDSGRSWLKADAGVLYGWYTGMAYLLPLIGGLIADKLIGTHRSMIVGGLLIAMGHIVLGLSGIGTMALSDMGMTVFVMGLALITIGTGHFKPSVSVMVGQLYPIGDPRRESAFSIFYMGINLGSFLCNLVCGYLAVRYGWHYGFGAAAVGMILGLGTYVAFRRSYLGGIGEPVGNNGNKAAIFLPVGILAAAGIAWLYHIGILGIFDVFVSQTPVVIVIALAAIAYAVWLVSSQQRQDRGPVATIFIYMLFNALFWLSFEQAGSSLNIFTQELTDRTIGGWEVPTPYFQSINPLLIIIFAPIFGVVWASLARRNKYVAQPFKIGAGLIFVGLGYVVMVMAALRLDTGLSKVSMIYISGCYFLHTVGEIILSPTGLSYVAKTAPRKSVSSLMGIWFLSSFIANLAAGKVSALVDPIIEGKQKLPWNFGGQADFFFLFVVSSCAAGVLIIVIAPILTRLQRNRND